MSALYRKSPCNMWIGRPMFKMKLNLCFSCEMAQVVSRRPLTAEAWVCIRLSLWGFVVDKVVLVQIYLRVLGFSCQYHSTMVLYIHVTRGMNIRPVRFRSSETVSLHRHEQALVFCADCTDVLFHVILSDSWEWLHMWGKEQNTRSKIKRSYPGYKGAKNWIFCPLPRPTRTGGLW
jgi:hypothetical protein